MTGEHRKAQARVVVTGVDENGKSTIVSDGPTPVRLETPGMTICDLWEVENLPSNVADKNASNGDVRLDPAKTGFVTRVTTFAPDSEWDMAAQYEKLLADMGNADALEHDDSGIAGLHQSDTVDIVTIISGEVYAVLETGETLLRQGDSIVTRGTKHGWSNRSDKPCTLFNIMWGAVR